MHTPIPPLGTPGFPVPVFRDALDSFREMKLKLKPISLPQLPYGDVAEVIISAEGSSAFEALIRGDRLETLADERQKAGPKSRPRNPSIGIPPGHADSADHPRETSRSLHAG